MTDHQEHEVVAPAWLASAVPGLLVSAVLGIAGLFMQVTRIDQAMAAVREDIGDLKNDARERLSGLEERVRVLEMKGR